MFAFFYFFYIFFVIGMVLALSVATYLTLAISAYNLAKKAGYDKAWLAWIPGMDRLVLLELKGDAPFTIFKGHLTVNDRFLFGLLFCVGRLLLISIANSTAAIPVVTGHIDFLIMKEFFGRYNADEKANRKKALVIALVDSIVLGGLLRGIFQLIEMNKEPLAVPVTVEN